MNAPRFQMPVERLPIQAGPVDVTIPWNIRDLHRWIDQDIRVNVEAWIDDCEPGFRVVSIYPADRNFETLHSACALRSRLLFFKLSARLEKKDTAFERAVFDAAREAGLFVGEAA